MKQVTIFVEGKSPHHSTDSAFLRDCILQWFNKNINLSDNFKHIGGASEFTQMAPDIRRAKSTGEVILIIDADNNPAMRKEQIKKFQVEENLSFHYFLFPDNINNGEVESLLEHIATDTAKMRCYENYEKCIGIKLDVKDKLFAYITAVTGNKEYAKDKNRSFRNAHFNLDHDCLLPLKDFLKPFFA